ncbi:MAG: DNA mismatch repair endonuclease MutL [Clostridia bacterium]|nr:DNA mismatch repair endonuclease MutL [Clostridia bacterium]
MPKINVLPKNVAELIAAGEVVERPASVIKELIENSIDAGATTITVEIQNGGISYMRITDNGCGILGEDVPLAFLRHATSKIKEGNDLNFISTLGFRGEALAAVSSVSRVEMLTCSENEEIGTHYMIEGGQEVLYEEAGCPKGTTIIIRDLFYNTPARMKFLKKDVSEANACAAVVDRIALSHPEISIKFIRDGKQTLNTSGDGQIKSAVYSVLGREFANSLISCQGEHGGITVSGLICKPVACKPTRNNQFTFLNGRLVRSGTIIAAVEQAYKNSAMIGKFPVFVLYVNVPFDTVDVNVHPAKTEVRFSDEKRIFESVYASVKNALSQGDTRPEIKMTQPTFNRFERMTVDEFKQTVIKVEEPKAPTVPVYEKKAEQRVEVKNVSDKKPQSFTFQTSQKPDFADTYSYVDQNGQKTEPVYTPKVPVKEVLIEKEIEAIIDEDKPIITVIGQAFNTYIIAQMGDSIFMIDKHAAHERILFNKLKEQHKIEVQALLTPITANLQKDEYNAIIGNLDLLSQAGFEIEDFGASTVVVRAIPTTLIGEDVLSLLSEMAESLKNTKSVQIEREENLFHTVACKAAIKAGSQTSNFEMKALAEKVLLSKDIMYCPHGRPVAYEIKKRELEKQFGRIQ